MVAIICKEAKFDGIEAVIFDKDGTLEDSQAFSLRLVLARIAEIEARIPNITSALLRTLGIKNGALDAAGLMAVGSRQETELAAAACIATTGCSWYTAKQIANEAFEAASKLVVKDSTSAWLFPDCLPVLESMATSGLKLGILSADFTVEVKAFIDRCGLSEYIQLAMGVDGELNKPDPRLFIKACQALAVNPGNALMIGDSQGDIAMATAARAAGTIGINWRGDTSKITEADVTIYSLSEIQVLKSFD